jgi:P-type conjugative transfer protein TrbJ
MKKTLLITTALVLITSLSPGTGIPVVDFAAIAESIKQGLQQIQIYTNAVSQLQTQINTYKNQLLQATGLAQTAQIWSQAQGTMNQVMGTVNMFRGAGGLQSYMDQFRDVNYWLATSPNQYTSRPAGYWSSAQKTANAQMVREISQQEQQIQSDSQLLQRLQVQAGSVGTERQALDVANEMAGLQEKQLLEIRTLLISEQQALATRNGTVATDEAMKQSATQQYYRTQFGAQPHTGW